MEKVRIVLVLIAFIGITLIEFSMYVLPYIERYKGLEMPFFLFGLFLLFVFIVLIKKFGK